jgi:riboflavin transporter FmnP
MRTMDIAGGAIFGVLAVIIRISGIKIPFPPIPYLVFEFSEVPVVLSLLIFGPLAGIISALCCWAILNAIGEFVPIGPAMFLAASLSTICGIYAGIRVVGRIRLSIKAALLSGYVAGLALRSTIMTLLNYIVVVILMPKFLEFAATNLSAFLHLSGSANVIVLILIFTAIFNIIQVTIIYMLSLAIVRIVNLAFPKIWITISSEMSLQKGRH